MFHIKFDRTNIFLLVIAGLMAVWSIFVPTPAGGLFPLIIALLFSIFIRSIYSISNKAALILSIVFLLIPVVLYTLYRLVTSGSPVSSVVLKALPWIITVFIALELGGIFLAVSFGETPSVSSETINKWEVSNTLRNVKRHFGFMLEKGYTISDLYYVDHLPYGGWHFQLDSPDDRSAFIFDEQGSTVLAVRQGRLDKKPQTTLEALVYHLTGKYIFAEALSGTFRPGGRRMKNDAVILKTYLEPIEKYLRDHPEIPDNEFIDITEQLDTFLRREYERRR